MVRRTLIACNVQAHRAQLLSINVNYFSWVFAEIGRPPCAQRAGVVGMGAPDYAAVSLVKICKQAPSVGALPLRVHQGRFTAIGDLRGLSGAGAEIKRKYGLGACMLDRLMDDASRFGYQRLCRERTPFMRSAHRAYEAAGFVERAPTRRTKLQKPFWGDGGLWKSISGYTMKPNPSINLSRWSKRSMPSVSHAVTLLSPGIQHLCLWAG